MSKQGANTAAIAANVLHKETPAIFKGANSLTPKQERKTKYDMAALVPVICQRIAEGATLTGVCAEPQMPDYSTFCMWVREHEAVSNEYMRAREMRADARADRIDKYTQMMIAKEIDPQQCRVAIDAEKWQAGKEQPKRYGDKLELSGEVGVRNLTEEQIDARIAEYTAKIQQD